jgi:hypothetical protein
MVMVTVEIQPRELNSYPQILCVLFHCRLKATLVLGIWVIGSVMTTYNTFTMQVVWVTRVANVLHKLFIPGSRRPPLDGLGASAASQISRVLGRARLRATPTTLLNHFASLKYIKKRNKIAFPIVSPFFLLAFRLANLPPRLA